MIIPYFPLFDNIGGKMFRIASIPLPWYNISFKI